MLCSKGHYDGIRMYKPQRFNTNIYPRGVTTHDPSLMAGLAPEEKKHKVAQFHKETIESFIELTAASDLRSIDFIDRSMIKQ